MEDVLMDLINSLELYIHKYQNLNKKKGAFISQKQTDYYKSVLNLNLLLQKNLTTLISQKGITKHIYSEEFENSRAKKLLDEIKGQKIVADLLKSFEGEIDLYWEVGTSSEFSREVKKEEELFDPLKGNDWRVNPLDSSNNKIENAGTLSISKEMIETNSNISLVTTIVHELLHSKVGYAIMDKYKGLLPSDIDSLNPEPDLAKKIEDKFPGITEAYEINPNEGEHEYMAMYMRKDIINVIKAFDKDSKEDKRKGMIKVNGKLRKYTPKQFYEGMSWSGLSRTNAWLNLPNKKRELYHAIIIQEEFAKNND